MQLFYELHREMFAKAAYRMEGKRCWSEAASVPINYGP